MRAFMVNYPYVVNPGMPQGTVKYFCVLKLCPCVTSVSLELGNSELGIVTVVFVRSKRLQWSQNI